MAFSFRCLLAHSWDGCVCRRCNPEGRPKLWGWRNRRHDPDGCVCRRCGQTVHDWDGCVCRRCEVARDERHDPRDGRCAKCGAAVQGLQAVACRVCGGLGTAPGMTDPQGDRCAGCGGSGMVQVIVYGEPAEPCLRPRRRPDTERRLAAARQDSNVAALARGIHESEDWSGFAPLRDALLEAGCTDEEVLNHCRREQHARDCWVLRLLLGPTPTDS
jgi:hypothetical protein